MAASPRFASGRRPEPLSGRGCHPVETSAAVRVRATRMCGGEDDQQAGAVSHNKKLVVR